MPDDATNHNADCAAAEAKLEAAKRAREEAERKAAEAVELEDAAESEAQACIDKRVAEVKAMRARRRKPLLEYRSNSRLRIAGVGLTRGLAGYAVVVLVLMFTGNWSSTPAGPTRAEREAWLEGCRDNLLDPQYREGRRMLGLDQEKP